MKNDTTFVRMRSGDHLWDAKTSKKAPRFVEFNFLTNCNKQNGSRKTKEEGKICKTLPQILYFAPGLSYNLSKFVDDFTYFFDFKLL